MNLIDLVVILESQCFIKKYNITRIKIIQILRSNSKQLHIKIETKICQNRDY